MCDCAARLDALEQRIVALEAGNKGVIDGLAEHGRSEGLSQRVEKEKKGIWPVEKKPGTDKNRQGEGCEVQRKEQSTASQEGGGVQEEASWENEGILSQVQAEEGIPVNGRSVRANGDISGEFVRDMQDIGDGNSPQETCDRSRPYYKQGQSVAVSQLQSNVGPYARQRGTSSEGDRLLSVSQEEFNRFWKYFPKKVGKKAALKAFVNAKDRPRIDDLLEAVRRACLSENWRKDGGQFIPNPATWLNQGRWDDEPVHIAIMQPKAQSFIAPRQLEPRNYEPPPAEVMALLNRIGKGM